jgi:pimeloyl-ACP methyl ester carboxylesterase
VTTARQSGPPGQSYDLAVSERSRLVDLSTCRVFLRDHGERRAGPPLLLLHGMLVTSHVFVRLIPELSRDFQVLAPDLPGTGDSDRPPPILCHGYSARWLAGAVLEMLDAIACERVDIVGHSWGGAVAACLVDAAPERVRRLVLVDPTVFEMPVPIEGRLAQVPGLGPYVFKNWYRRAELRRYLGRAFSSEMLVDEGDVDIYWDRLARSGGREAAHAMLMQLMNPDAMGAMIPRLRGLVAPTLVVWGDRDQIVPREHAQRVTDTIPGAQLRWIEGCGHSPAEERPEALASLIREHLA